jgi:hypothetical protein
MSPSAISVLVVNAANEPMSGLDFSRNDAIHF